MMPSECPSCRFRLLLLPFRAWPVQFGMPAFRAFVPAV